MTDKELNQIEAMLAGQTYKLLDCDRLAFLKLPSSCLHVWLTCWLHERDTQESWLSNEKIASLTGLSVSTIKRARGYLLKTGWFVETGSTAASKYANPTAGARQVKAVRVDDPSKRGVQIEPGQIEPQVYVSDSVSSSSCITVPPSIANVANGGSNGKDQNEKPKTKPARLTSGGTRLRSSAEKWLSKYDSPKPVDFDTWTQPDRSRWSLEHRRRSVSDGLVPAPPAAPATGYHSVFDPACSRCLKAGQPCAWEDFDD